FWSIPVCWQALLWLFKLPERQQRKLLRDFYLGRKNLSHLVLEYVPRNSAVAWAKSIVSSNTDKEVIVVTHSYLFYDGTTVDECDTSDMDGDNNGALLWTRLLSQYHNVSVV